MNKTQQGRKPRALDLFCKAGGATEGLMRAGFHVTLHVDKYNQPRYVGDCFRNADALRYPLGGFDFIWASPPCQDHMEMPHKKHGTGWILPATRERLLGTSSAWAIEHRSRCALAGRLFVVRLYVRRTKSQTRALV